jgi:hypothetical protein
MFKLAERRGSRPAALIKRREGRVCLRAEDEVRSVLGAAYHRAPDILSFSAKMREVAVALGDEDITRAMIVALQMGLCELSDESIARLTETDSLSKHNFNPLQPRDWHGRWGGDQPAGVIPARAGGPPRRPASGGRAWERFPNPEFRNRLAIAENSFDKPEFGYREVNENTNAIGRCQMRPAAL